MYSKNQVDRAGRLMRDLTVIEGHECEPVPVAGERFIEALTIIEWWRALHARPLRRVNANLRYYVSKVGAGEHSVTSRGGRSTAFASMSTAATQVPRATATGLST